MLRPALLLGCACWTTLAVAQPAQLGEGEIRELVSGAMVALDTPLGTKIPIRYEPDGRVDGEARGLAFYLGSARDTGTWWIKSGELCHRWTRWFDRKVQCLALSRQGQTIHWRNQDGRTGTASVTAAPQIKIAEAAQTAAPPSPARPLPEGAMHLSAPKPPPLTSPPAARPTPPALASPWTVTAVKARKPQPAPPSRQPAEATRSTAQTSPPPLLPQPQPAAPTFVVANVEQDDVLNVRAGPSAEHDIVATLAPGSGGITIAGACRAGWCPITLETTAGWVNRRFLEQHNPGRSREADAAARSGPIRDAPEAPRGCLTPAARALLEQIEARFGPVRLVSTCRTGATIAGSGRPSRHASGNAFDFDAGSRKVAIVEWLIAHHRGGGTMTYPHMDHIHADIGPHFVALAGGRRWASWRDGR